MGVGDATQAAALSWSFNPSKSSASVTEWACATKTTTKRRMILDRRTQTGTLRVGDILITSGRLTAAQTEV